MDIVMTKPVKSYHYSLPVN